jgi:hypothetical protein
MDPRVAEFVNTDLKLLSFAGTVVCIWIIACIVVMWARRIRHNPKPVITEFYPPQDCGPIFALFMLSSGKQGGMIGEISPYGTQTALFMSLFEAGLLDKLSISSEQIEYSINPNFENISAPEEEKIFIKKLNTEIGSHATLTAAPEKDVLNGYTALANVWLTFWFTDLNALAVKRNLIVEDGFIQKFFSIIAGSITFGLFFGVFAFSFIPFIGTYLALILIAPLFVLYVLNETLFSSLIKTQHPFITAGIATENVQLAVVVVGFLSWFVWLVMFGQSMSKINRALTPEGHELVQKVKGYKQFLATVDKDRLSFSFNRSLDFERNKTSFAWLAIFELVTDTHWRHWYEVTDTSVAEPVKIHI